MGRSMSDVVNSVAHYLNGSPINADCSPTLSEHAFRVKLRGKEPVFAKTIAVRSPEYETHTAFDLASREMALAQLLLRFGAAVPHVIPRKNPPLFHGEDERSLVVYEWLDLRPINETRQDAEAILRAYGESVGALERAGKGIGPWRTFPHNGPRHWQLLAASARQRSNAAPLQELVKRARSIGTLERQLPLDPTHPDRFLYFADVGSVVQRLPINMFVRDDGSNRGIMVDLSKIHLSEGAGRRDSCRDVILWASNFMGEGEAVDLFERSRDSVHKASPFFPLAGVQNEAPVAKQLEGLRQDIEDVFLPSSTQDAIQRIDERLRSLKELAPDFFRGPRVTNLHSPYL